MVDRDVVLRAEALQENESLLNDVCFDLLQALQACIDLAVHACSHEALGGPESPLAARMTKAAAALRAHAG